MRIAFFAIMFVGWVFCGWNPALRRWPARGCGVISGMRLFTAMVNKLDLVIVGLV
jgi:hypothetical protein